MHLAFLVGVKAVPPFNRGYDTELNMMFLPLAGVSKRGRKQKRRFAFYRIWLQLTLMLKGIDL